MPKFETSVTFTETEIQNIIKEHIAFSLEVESSDFKDVYFDWSADPKAELVVTFKREEEI